MKKSNWIIVVIIYLFLSIASTTHAVLTEGDVTIKLSGGDYSSWAEFWNDLGNLTGDITCTVDADAFPTENTPPAYITENLNGYTLKVTAATFPTTTDATTGPRFHFNYDDDFKYLLSMGMEGPGTIIIEGIVVIDEDPTQDDYGYRGSSIDVSFTFIIRRCIMKGFRYPIYCWDNTPDYEIYNNFIYDARYGIDVRSDLSANSHISNNTAYGQEYNGIRPWMYNALYENNISYNSGTDDFWFSSGSNSTGNNNTSEDNTCADENWDIGSNNRPDQTADPFVDSANDDFRLASGSDPIDNAKDLSAKFTTDFFGVVRTDVWDIGAHECGAAGIEQVSFSAVSESHYIKLQWKLEMEDACLQYLILKKAIKEDSYYSEIARIAGSGSSPSPKSYSYKDENVEVGIRYYYKLGVVKTNGSTRWYGPVSAVVTGTKSFMRVSPNPFSTSTTISFTRIGQSAEGIELKIFDVVGKLVKNLSLGTRH